MPDAVPDAVPERDWVQVVRAGRCPECGLDAAATPTRRLADSVRSIARRWRLFLAATPDDRLRHRPRGDHWSALEYAAHTRDVLSVFAERVDLALHAEAPELGWWDHEQALIDGRYNEQDRDAVAAMLESNADLLATTIDSVPDDGWERIATRRSETFTVAGLARFALHEAHHHLLDAERAAI